MIARRAPTARRRAKPRAWKSPRCEVRGCKKPQDVKWGRWINDVPIQEFPVDPSKDSRFHAEHGMCRSHSKQEADRRFSRFIRDRDRGCRIRTETGCVGPLSCCHLLSRRFMATRYDEKNAVAGCAGHHAYWTVNPDRWAAYLQGFLGDDVLEWLRALAFGDTKPDLAEVLARYSA